MKITIVTAVLNCAAAFAETVRSVQACRRPGVVHIVIDGGSSDGTLEVIRASAGHFAAWRSEPDRGVYDAMNKGWAMADPDSWILFLGAGDRLLSLPRELPPGAGSDTVLYGDVLLDGGRYFRSRQGLWLRLYNSLHHQGLLVPKRLHPDPPFDLAFPLYADFDFNQRLYRQGADFRHTSDLVAYAAPGGLTGELQLDEMTRIVRKNFGRFWYGLSMGGFSLARMLPVLGKLRPIRERCVLSGGDRQGL